MYAAWKEFSNLHKRSVVAKEHVSVIILVVIFYRG
jgi:hypothetical protein